MAFLAAAPAILGGMTVGTAILVGATGAAGIGAALSQRNAGIAASHEAKAQARLEGIAAKDRELDRRRDLLRALSSQNAAAGVGGVETSGSIGGIMRRNIRDASNDLLRDSANTSARVSGLNSKAKNARRQGNLAAATSLLDTAGKVVDQL